MGARGTDVARESAALVITDDDFGSIVGGVREGRGLFDKLRKAMSYIIAVHVPIAGMSLIPVFVKGWPLVLLPIQIAFLELIIDPACSVVFEAEQTDPETMSRLPRRPGAPMFRRRVLMIAALQGVSVLMAVFAVYLWGMLIGRTDDTVRSLTFATLVVGNLALILVNRSWRLSIARAIVERRNPAPLDPRRRGAVPRVPAQRAGAARRVLLRRDYAARRRCGGACRLSRRRVVRGVQGRDEPEPRSSRCSVLRKGECAALKAAGCEGAVSVVSTRCRRVLPRRAGSSA